ncbi:MAG: ABC transporter permease [Eubacteriales bacterium]|nr:ABC transporter permease [Eubacteriales bacterium]
MSRIAALCLQDFKRLLANALFWVITATLVLIVLVVNFALPKTVAGEDYPLYTYQINIPGATAVESEARLRELVRDSGAVGLLGTDGGILTVLNPGLSDKTIHAIMVLLFNPSAADTVKISVESLSPIREAVPFNKRMTPVFICFEALVIGFILGGTLMLSEKEESTVRALRVAPVSADAYLLSKTLLFSVIGTVYALLMAFLCIGFGFPILPFCLLSFFGSTVFSLIGLGFTPFFRDMSSWFFTMALVLAINMLPVVAYTEPSFSPLWLRAIPSYPLLFAYEDVLLGTGAVSSSAVFTVAGWCAGAYLLSRIIVGRRFLARGGR